MKMMSEWLETAIANANYRKSRSTVYLVVLLVLLVGAGSLYMLLNSPA
ncbi:MAG TPA: hypothetical protein VK369_05825 [Segetibacter sp.]|nr:hypothetical protein [Segetibacter sp.]